MDNLEILYGKHKQEGIVRIEVDGNDIIEYIKTDEMGVIENRIPNYKPYIYERKDYGNTKGNNHYNNIRLVNNITDYKRYFSDRENYLKTDIITNYLSYSGKTLFKGMDFDDVDYLSFDIETTGLDYSRAKVDKIKLGLVRMKDILPTKLGSLSAKIKRYLERNDTVSVDELKRLMGSDNIYYYMLLWKTLYEKGVLTDIGDVIKMITISTKDNEYLLHDKPEKELISDFIKIVNEDDPSLILGFNSSSFDIPFLIFRGWINGISLNIGKDGTDPSVSFIQVRLGVGRVGKNLHWHIYGRNYIDLYPAVKKYDFLTRELDSFKLKAIMSTYGLEREGRLVLTADEIQQGLNSPKDSQKYKDIVDYALDDARDLYKLYEYIGQADFYLTQMIPMNYDVLIYAGNVTRTNALLIRNYVDNKYSMPKWQEFVENDDLYNGMVLKYIGENSSNFKFLKKNNKYQVTDYDSTHFTLLDLNTNDSEKLLMKWLQVFKINVKGAEVQADDTGIFYNVGDSDIASMYPSIMIEYDLFPETDELQTMKSVLILLRDMRFNLKKSMKKLTKGERDYKVAFGRQLAVKIGINAMYGATMSNGFYFKDPDVGSAVTKHGRDMIIKLRDYLVESGYKVTSIDTDGISYTNGQPIDIDVMDNILSTILPNGIGIETTIYEKLIVFARKTYFGLYPDGEYVIKGAALTTRSAPMVYRRYVKKLCQLLCDNDYTGLRNLYDETILLINSGKLPLDEFIMSKSISRSLKVYQQENEDYLKNTGKNKSKDGVYELAIATNRDIKMGDKVQYYQSYDDIVLTDKNRDNMDLLFQTDVKPKRETKIKWVDDYDNDLNLEYYIDLINKKTEALLHKQYDKRKESWYGVLSKTLYSYIVGNNQSDLTAFKYVDVTDKSEGYFNKWKRMELDNVDDIMKDTPIDYFVTVQQFENEVKSDNETVYCPIYFDFDSDNLDNSFNDTKIVYNYFKNQLKVSDILVYFSGSKGFHIELNPRLFNIQPMPQLQLVYKEMALDLIAKYKLKTVDIGSIYSERRMWRLPFSIHSKTGYKKTWLKDFDDLNDIDDVIDYIEKMDYPRLLEEYIAYKKRIDNKVIYDNESLKLWMNKYYRKLHNKTKHLVFKKPSQKYKELDGQYPKCINALLSQSISKAGDRNQATMILVSFFKELGMSKEDCQERAVEWTCNIPTGLTSTTSLTAINSNVKTVINTIYNSDSYNFQCFYIYPLLKSIGFKCPNKCSLKD